jgi:hypothetical protein
VVLLALALAGPVLSAAEASLFHGRTRFAHPAMWVPAAYGLLQVGLGVPCLLDPLQPLARLGYYFLLWVGLAVGVSGCLWHLRQGLRALRAASRGRWRRLAVGPPPLAPLAFAIYAVLGLVAFHLGP